MPRIRTIKPEFFRHEELQDLEAHHPGLYPMLVFVGLWGHCDKLGHFPWKPRHLKLDILPFLDFDFAASLSLLSEHDLISSYQVDGASYGSVTNFTKHQRISGKEAIDPPKYPLPKGFSTGNIREAPEKRPVALGKGKGRDSSSPDIEAISGSEVLKGHFHRFWKQWPRKQAKQLAVKAFEKAMKIADVETLMAGVETYIATKPENESYCHASTWLNQRRWTDEPYEAPHAKARRSSPDDPEEIRRKRRAGIVEGLNLDAGIEDDGGPFRDGDGTMEESVAESPEPLVREHPGADTGIGQQGGPGLRGDVAAGEPQGDGGNHGRALGVRGSIGEGAEGHERGNGDLGQGVGGPAGGLARGGGEPDGQTAQLQQLADTRGDPAAHRAAADRAPGVADNGEGGGEDLLAIPEWLRR